MTTRHQLKPSLKTLLISSISSFDLVARISTRTSSSVPRPCWNRNVSFSHLFLAHTAYILFIWIVYIPRTLGKIFQISLRKSVTHKIRWVRCRPLWPSWAGRHQIEGASWAEQERRPLSLTWELTSELYPGSATKIHMEGWKALVYHSIYIMAFLKIMCVCSLSKPKWGNVSCYIGGFNQRLSQNTGLCCHMKLGYNGKSSIIFQDSYESTCLPGVLQETGLEPKPGNMSWV